MGASELWMHVHVGDGSLGWPEHAPYSAICVTAAAASVPLPLQGQLAAGGRLVILEFERPRFALMRWFYDFYCGWIMPRTATIISGDKSGAYRYLPRSVGTFMNRAQLSDLLRTSGFTDVTSKGLSLGICVCYRGVRTV